MKVRLFGLELYLSIRYPRFHLFYRPANLVVVDLSLSLPLREVTVAFMEKTNDDGVYDTKTHSWRKG